MQVSLYPLANRGIGPKSSKPSACIHFSGNQNPKPAKSKKQFGTKSLFSIMTYVASGAALLVTGRDTYQAAQKIAIREEYRSKVLFQISEILSAKRFRIPEYADLDGTPYMFIRELEIRLKMLHEGPDGKLLLQRWDSDELNATRQYYGVFSTLTRHEALLKKHPQGLSKTTLRALYEDYLKEPESLNIFGWGRFQEKDNKLMTDFQQYRMSKQGKRNPVSMDDFALLTDTYQFYSNVTGQPDSRKDLQAVYHEYLQTVIAKHAQNPNLPDIKAYSEKMQAAYEKAFEKLDDEHFRVMSTHYGYLGYQLLILMVFHHWAKIAGKFRKAKSLAASQDSTTPKASKETKEA